MSQDLATLSDETPDTTTDEQEIEKDEKLLADETEEVDETTEEEPEEKEEKEEQVPLEAKELVDGLKGKYPNLLKEFPQLRGAIYSSREYSKIFTNPDEARESVEELENFRGLSNHLLEGQISNLLEAVGRTDANALAKLTSSFLPTLQKMNEGLFYKAMTPYFKGAIRNIIEEGKRTGNKNLEQSGYWVSNHLFGEKEPTLDKPIKEDPEKVELQKQLRERNQNDLNSFEETTKGETYSYLVGETLSTRR